MTKKTWGLFVLVAGLGVAVLLSMSNAFVPAVADIKDPLGRPSALSLEVIHSASEFDRLTSVLVPKHGKLAVRIQTLNTVATDLDILVDNAGDLTGKAKSVNAHTVSVRSTATPLPGLINRVTGRAQEAAPVVGNLGSAVSSVTGQLRAINGGLAGIYGDLSALGPRADTIAHLLADIENESKRVKPLAPVLATLAETLGPVLDGPVGKLLADVLAALKLS